MKYETPELTAVIAAVSIIQSGSKTTGGPESGNSDAAAAYEDWE